MTTIDDTTTLDGAAETTTDGAELLARATELAPTLRERAASTAAGRRLPVETVDDLRTSGVLKVLQSEANGGYELGMREHLDVIAALARGCGSTSWVAGVLHAHSWMMSHFSREAQDETYGTDPDAFICAVVTPRGTAEPTADGYRLSGFWPFASGCEHSDWMFLGGVVLDDGEPVDEGEFLVPTSEVTILDDWHVTGLTGTGSCSVRVDDLHVPAHRYLSMPALIGGTSPGSAVSVGWNHQLAAVPVLVLALAGSALGMARQSLDDFAEVIGDKVIAYTPYVQREHTTTHLTLAQAAARVDEAEFHLYRSVDELDSIARSGGYPEPLHRARMRLDASEAVVLCREAVELLWNATGGSGLRTSNPLGMTLANLQAMSMHGALHIETARELYGRVRLGLEPDTPLL